MARIARRDEPGDWFHLMNRALARRTLFESRADVGLFLDRVAEVVERGLLEVHCYSVMATHFHFMVRSPQRALSEALHHIQLGYVRYFNRSRRRDGPLVRGRFRSLLLDSFEYRKNLVGNIDANAVHAGVVADAADYEFSSSHAYACGDGPDWLSREWTENVVADAFGPGGFTRERYRELFHARFDQHAFAFVDQRVRRGQCGSDPTDSLLVGAAPEVLRWMQAKARLADGTRPGLPVVPAGVISTSMAVGPHAPCLQNAKQLVRVESLLLRDLAHISHQQLGKHARMSRGLRQTAGVACRPRCGLRRSARRVYRPVCADLGRLPCRRAILTHLPALLVRYAGSLANRSRRLARQPGEVPRPHAFMLPLHGARWQSNPFWREPSPLLGMRLWLRSIGPGRGLPRVRWRDFQWFEPGTVRRF